MTALLCAGLVVAAADELQAKPSVATYGATSRVRLDASVKAKRMDPMAVAFRIPGDVVDQVLAQGAAVTLECTFDAGRKGVKVTVAGTIVDSLGRPTAVPLETARTRKDGTATVSYALPVAGALGGTFEFRLTFDPAGSKRISGYTGACAVHAAVR